MLANLDNKKLVYPAAEYSKIAKLPEDWGKALGDSNFSAIISGASGCLHEDTEVMTTKGSRRLKDLPNSFMVKSYNFRDSLMEDKPAIRIQSGSKKVFRIKLKNRSTVVASEDHIFFTKRQGIYYEVRLNELKEGDSIFVMRK